MNTIVVFYIVLVTRLTEYCSNARRQAGMVYIEGHWRAREMEVFDAHPPFSVSIVLGK
jgi:hypothetical protein